MNTPYPTTRHLGPPRWFLALFNPIAETVLRSPLHWVLSRKVLLITYTGRKTGRVLTTPILYERTGDILLLKVAYPWWKNLRGGASVRVLLRGQVRTGTAEVFPEDTGLVPVKIHLNR